MPPKRSHRRAGISSCKKAERDLCLCLLYAFFEAAETNIRLFELNRVEIRDFRFQKGILIYKSGFSVTNCQLSFSNWDSCLANGILVLQFTDREFFGE